MNKLKELEVIILGNKVTLLGYSLIATGLETSICYANSPYMPWFILTVLSGGFLAATTKPIKETLDKYQETMRYIKRSGKLDEFFLKKVFSKNHILCEYCHAQGVYLAARKEGFLNQFFNAKKKYSNNIIPHF